MGNRNMPGSTSLEQKTMEYLWNAANELKGIAPTISQRLASRLVTSIPEDGMSSFAKRKHCDGCAALISTSKLRVRKVVKKTRRRPESFRNVIIITCEMCGARIVEKGVRRDCRPAADEAEMHTFRKRLLKKVKMDKKMENEKLGDSDRGIEKTTQTTGAVVRKKKRKRRKSEENRNETKSAPAPKSGFAASFLFDPL
eukprot:gb/GEZJ01001060.1/.p2 GENE.gb/GEZJ01001060.1/~~gb/GEZJ01001060.1/.p2  ORF type:complete len:198 (+),score=37.93 gb/GEZJ01001060.1/:325-918(+)